MKRGRADTGDGDGGSGLEESEWDRLVKALKANDLSEAERIISQIRVEELTQTRPDIGYTNSPIHLAVNNGYTGIASLLLDKNPDLINLICTGWSPLSLAVRYSKVEVAKLLLGKGALLEGDKSDFGFGTVLHTATENNNEELVRELLTRHPELINVTNENGLTALNLAQSEKIEELLIQAGSQCGYTADALRLAAENGRKKIIELLLQTKPELINEVDNEGKTALDYAAQGEHNEVVKFLLKVKSGLSDEGKKAAFDWAAYNGYVEVAESILQAQPRLADKDDLQTAISYGNGSLVELLFRVKPELANEIDLHAAMRNAIENNRSSYYSYRNDFREPVDFEKVIKLVQSKLSFEEAFEIFSSLKEKLNSEDEELYDDSFDSKETSYRILEGLIDEIVEEHSQLLSNHLGSRDIIRLVQEFIAQEFIDYYINTVNSDNDEGVEPTGESSDEGNDGE